MFRWLFGSGARLENFSGARLEDFADRLNHVWTFGLLLLLGVIIGWKHIYQSPISCWCPIEFSGSMVEYTHQTCWHSYYIQEPWVDDHPMSLSKFGLPIVRQEKPAEDDMQGYTTTYYQWLPVVLCLQAFLFKLPNIVMYIFHSYSGVDFHKLSELTAGYENLNLTERINLSNQIARYIYRWCNMFPRGIPWRLITVTWLLVKIMYCVNIVTQMAYIDKFLTTTNVPYDNSTSYGNTIYNNIAKNNATSWKLSLVFPAKVMCAYSIRQLRNVQKYMVQCDLNANRFSESAYMFLWVWLLFVSVVTMLSFVAWVIMTVLPIGRERYIRRFMELGNCDGAIAHLNNQDVSMVTSLLGEDGVMVLKLISANSSELLVRDVVFGISRIVRGGASLSSGQGIQPDFQESP